MRSLLALDAACAPTNRGADLSKPGTFYTHDAHETNKRGASRFPPTEAAEFRALSRELFTLAT